MTLLSMALKPIIIPIFIGLYKFLLYVIEKYLPRSVSDFLLKNR